MLTFAVTLHFPGQFVAHPYWPEMFQMIEITKQSGMSRARASQNRRKALEEHLRAIGMTVAQFDTLSAQASLPFHTNAAGAIIIPADNILSFLVATCDEARSAQRPCPKEQVRSRFVSTDFVTDRTAQDGVWTRFATVASGVGQKLSNQRGLRENPYIADFRARGALSFDPQFVRPEVARAAIAWGGEMVGLGASRKMGKGRFVIEQWVEQPSARMAAE